MAPEQLAALLERAGDVAALAPAATALKSLVGLAAGARLAGVTASQIARAGSARPSA